jgi:hypothetical protein
MWESHVRWKYRILRGRLPQISIAVIEIWVGIWGKVGLDSSHWQTVGGALNEHRRKVARIGVAYIN